jgi:hypothetical protein
MRESKIEAHLRKQVVNYDPDGMCYKWKSPSNKGVTDRIVMMNRQVWFVELKSTYGELSAIQGYVGKKIKRQTDNYRVISSKKGVDAFIEEVMK